MACNSTAPVSNNSIDETQSDLKNRHQGTVTLAFADSGCEVLIKMMSKSEHTYLIPIGLEDKYKEEGLVLDFNYRVSRAHQGSCRKGQTAILEDITENE